MATTFLDEKISSFIEERFPEFVRTDHPVFVEFLKLYYQFMEAAKITLTNVQAYDTILLENLLTENFLLLEDGVKVVGEDSTYGTFLKDENVTGQASGAVAQILAEDNANTILYIEHNRFFQVGEIIVGATSGARGTISKYQGNPIQNIQQLLEYADVDKTLTDFLDQFRDTYLTAVPNTLASGVSKRNLVKSVRDLYRAKGTKAGHELFFRLMFGETPELFYPTDNLLKISAGDWTSNTVIRVVATANNPANLVGQTITQTIDPDLGATAATAIVESTLQIQEGETIIYELILNLDSVSGTFISGAEITGVDSIDADVAITATVQSIIIGVSVDTPGSFYTTNDEVTVTSVDGLNADVNVVDVGSGELDEIVIDASGINYVIGQDLYFDNINTEGSGASAKIINIGGALGPEIGDYDRVVSGSTVQGEYRNTIASVDHIIYEEATEQTDAYTGAQIQLETATFTNLSVADESSEVVHVLMNNRGSGYESPPSVVSTTAKITWASGAITGSSKEFVVGETITTAAGASATIAAKGTGYITITGVTGTFSASDKITGSSSTAYVIIVSYTAHGTGATFLPWSQSGIGSVKGVEVTKFGTGFTSAPSITLPVKLLVTRYDSSSPNITLSTSFVVGETLTGQSSTAIGVITEWNNARQLLTVKLTSGTFLVNEVITRGATSNYAIITKLSSSILASSIGTVGTTTGAFDNDKGKLSESLMKIQDSYYYQDFSYVVRVGSAIKDWRGEIKKAVHPAGFAVFGEVSLTNKVETKLTVPITGVSTYTPTLASIFEAALTTIIGRRLGTDTDGTTLRTNAHLGHKIELTHDIEAATRVGTTVTIETTGPHGFDAVDEVEIRGITSTGYDGVYQIQSVTDDTFTVTVSGSPTTPAVFVLGSAQASAISAFDSSTRDVTMSSYKELTIQTLYSGTVGGFVDATCDYNNDPTISHDTNTRMAVGMSVSGTGIPAGATIASVTSNTAFELSASTTGGIVTNGTLTFDTQTYDSLQKNRYGLGATKKTATKYLWSVGGGSDTTPVRMDKISYAYPNIIRRKVPETGTDNVTAGSAGVYDSTMNYTTIQMGVYDAGTQMTLESFGGVQIDEIVRPSRVLISSVGDDVESILMEDGTYHAYEEYTPINDHVIPSESNKIWNVPPPSYIRGVNISANEYLTFDDGTTPPDFSDNTAPPSFDTTIGT